MSTNDVVIIIYGNGGELGDFGQFANNLKNELNATHKKIIVKYINRDYDFFNLLGQLGQTKKITQLHIFAHSIGAGIFLGYHDQELGLARGRAMAFAKKRKSRLTYAEVVKIETGSIQTDDFKLPQIAAKRDLLRGKFAKGGLIKIWGCNSGVANWVYSDGGVVDPRNNSVDYYWRALNEFNFPKPSIASAFAQFFNVKVYGARSGAHIAVRHQGHWVKSSQYKQNVGHWPGPKLPLKLVPDKGSYHEYLP